MTKMILIFSHKLTEEQKRDAKKTLDVNEFVKMPSKLESLWKDIPPSLETLKEYLEPFEEWLDNITSVEDYVFIHGDPGAVYLLVRYAFEKRLVPIYSTTKREVIQEITEDNNVLTKKFFRHCRFRVYGS
ncbi:MAG: CRISPR-associated protein Csx20 [Candidatus Hodarchaeales archaeon]